MQSGNGTNNRLSRHCFNLHILCPYVCILYVVCCTGCQPEEEGAAAKHYWIITINLKKRTQVASLQQKASISSRICYIKEDENKKAPQGKTSSYLWAAFFKTIKSKSTFLSSSLLSFRPSTVASLTCSLLLLCLYAILSQLTPPSSRAKGRSSQA